MRICQSVSAVIRSLLFCFFMCNESFCQNPVLITQEGSQGILTQLAYSPDGRYIASICQGDYSIRIWDVITSKIIGTLKGHQGTIHSVSFSHDGNLLASGSEDRKIIIWDLNTWNIKTTVESHSKAVTSVVFTPNDSLLISGSEDKNIVIYSLLKAGISDTLAGSKTGITGISVDQSGKYLISLGKDNVISLWDLALKTIIRTFKTRNSILTYTAFLPQSTDFLSSGPDKTVRIWNIYHEKPQKVFQMPSKIYCLSINATGDKMIVSGKDQMIRIFSIQSGNEIIHFQTKFKSDSEDEIIRTIAFHPSGSYFAACSYTKKFTGRIKTGRNDILIFSASSGNLLKTLTGDVFPVQALAFNPAEGNLISISNNQLFLWDLQKAELSGRTDLTIRPAENKKDPQKKDFGRVSKTTSSDYRIKLSTDGHLLAIESPQEPFGLSIYIIENGNAGFYGNIICNNISAAPEGEASLAMQSILKQYPVYDFLITPDNKYVVIGTEGDTGIIFFSIATGKITRYLATPSNKNEYAKNNASADKDKVKCIAMTHNARYFAAAFESGKLMIWETSHYTPLFEDFDVSIENNVSFTGLSSLQLAFSNDDNFLWYSFEDLLYRLSVTESIKWPIERFKFDCNFSVINGNELSGAEFQGNKFFLCRKDTSTISRTLESVITGLSYSPDNRFLALGTSDGKIKLLDAVTGDEIISIINGQEGSYVFVTPEYYYKASKSGLDLVSFRVGKNAYPFEQFDLLFNRPDIVLQKLNSSDSTRIKVMRKAYEKRIRKMNFDESMLRGDFRLPETSILNRAEIPLITNNDSLLLKLKCSDKEYLLDRIILTVNNVPIYGSKGIPLKNLKSSEIQKDLLLPLANGKNIVKISCMNENGLESLREMVEITLKNEDTKPNLYLICIGTSTYKDSRFRLKYASKDAKDIAELFSSNKNQYKNIYVKTLTDNQVTKENILKLKAFLQKAGINDVVMVFLAGHGVLDSRLDYYYGTYDMDFRNPKLRGISYGEIESLLDGLPSLRKLLLMDTCHSGEVEKDDVEKSGTTQVEQGKVIFRSSGLGYELKPGLEWAASTELMKELFTDLRNGTGATVIASAGGLEFAVESDKWQNGLFTFCILNGLKSLKADANADGQVMLSELQDYVRKEVIQISAGKQVPVSRIENPIMDFRIW